MAIHNTTNLAHAPARKAPTTVPFPTVRNIRQTQLRRLVFQSCVVLHIAPTVEKTILIKNPANRTRVPSAKTVTMTAVPLPGPRNVLLMVAKRKKKYAPDGPIASARLQKNSRIQPNVRNAQPTYGSAIIRQTAVLETRKQKRKFAPKKLIVGGRRSKLPNRQKIRKFVQAISPRKR